MDSLSGACDILVVKPLWREKKCSNQKNMAITRPGVSVNPAPVTMNA
jgi:hypothetical protein